ncbi:MAG TPA: TetR family transcriptional regulator C-terminal domain-containing protein [Streptosporangiaceae bacterium]|nr:TetR family transcriptional regulator C-terminal domain-containing protein [Streptosporangiaceae bacterium]
MTSVDTTARRGGARRAGRRKVKVLEAAGRVIAERGADATRFTDVAAESAVPVSTLQYYFGSREDLLVAAFRHASGTEIAALEADLTALEDPWERLAFIVTRALAGYLDGGGQSGKLWIESWHFGIRDAEMRADTLRDYAAWRRLVAEAVRSGLDSGRFTTPYRPERIAVLTLALLDGVGIPLALGDPEITPDAVIADVMSALAELLHPGGSPG